MGNKSQRATITDNTGELTLQQVETDSPVLAVDQLEKLHTFKPGAVDWVIKETEKEADYRRTESRCIRRFVFIERFAGQVFGLIIGLPALSLGLM